MIFEMRINSNYRVGFPRIHHSSREGGSMDEVDYLLSPYSPYLKLAHTDNVKLLECDKQLYRRETLLFGHSPTSKSCLTFTVQHVGDVRVRPRRVCVMLTWLFSV